MYSLIQSFFLKMIKVFKNFNRSLNVVMIKNGLQPLGGFALGKYLRYGQIKGHSLNVGQGDVGAGYLWAASQVIGNQSGKFVFVHSDGRVTLNVAGSNFILGWALEYARTPTVDTVVSGGVNVALDAIFRIPINTGTLAASDFGRCCDLSVLANVQGAAINLSVENPLIIVGGDVASNRWVDVKINPVTQGIITSHGADD